MLWPADSFAPLAYLAFEAVPELMAAEDWHVGGKLKVHELDRMSDGSARWTISSGFTPWTSPFSVALEKSPASLTIRPSALIADGEPPTVLDLPTGTVHRRKPHRGNGSPAYSADVSPSWGDYRACRDFQAGNVFDRFHYSQ